MDKGFIERANGKIGTHPVIAALAMFAAWTGFIVLPSAHGNASGLIIGIAAGGIMTIGVVTSQRRRTRG